MMISHDKKFILIAPPKTASVSICSFFLPFANVNEIIHQTDDNFDFVDEGLIDCNFKYKYSKHNKVSAYSHINNFDEYYKIGCIRNPYDRVVSFWRWSCKVSFLNRIIYGLSLWWWLTRLKTNDWAKQTYFDYFSLNDNLIMNDYISIESINEDLNRICNKLDIKFSKPNILNQTNRKHWSHYHTPKTIKLTNELFKSDFKYFQYNSLSVD
jgi:hypothetical protein